MVIGGDEGLNKRVVGSGREKQKGDLVTRGHHELQVIWGFRAPHRCTATPYREHSH
jgi:hypothetical protein